VENHGDVEVSLFLQRRVALPHLYWWLMRITARFAIRHADLLRAVSSSTREQLQRWARDKQLLQFPAWTDIEVFLKVGPDRAQDNQDIVYVGVLTPGKGVHHLINAFAQVAPEFSQARLVIIGRAENSEYADGLKVAVTEGDLNGRVKFVGELSQAELAQRMQHGVVFVLPTYSEGLPRVVFEAMATGMPVVASNVGGIADMVQNGVNGFLVAPGDEVGLAERLRWFLGHPEEAKAMGRRAHEFAQRFFSTETYVNGYRQILQNAQSILREK
jgi:glycosyltransferase involved in cell wall biosynthesis